MEEEIKTFIQGNEIIKTFFQYPKEDLKVMRAIISLELIKLDSENVRYVKMCSEFSYDFLEYIMEYRNTINLKNVSFLSKKDKIKNAEKCAACRAKKCIKANVALLQDEVEKYNEKNSKKINCIEIIDCILKRKIPEFKSIPEEDFFENVDTMDLLYVQAILEMDLINIINYNEKQVELDYLDITEKKNNTYYIDILMGYYKNKENAKYLKIDLEDKDDIFKEKNIILKRYKIAAYYKYLIEDKKIDIILKLREILQPNREIKGMAVRSSYFIYYFFKKVEQLPYSNKTKEKIYYVLNYVLNYKMKAASYIPINILIYSSDKDRVEEITEIIGEFMWYFGYLNEDMLYYDSNMNDIILDEMNGKKIYYEYERDITKNKHGIITIHNFENLLSIEQKNQARILNILADEMEQNNEEVCTIIYGKREKMERLLENHKKLSNLLINFEIEIEDLDAEKVYTLLIEKIKKNVSITQEATRKLFIYIKDTYEQSDLKNTDYINKLYSEIVLNANKNFDMNRKIEIKSEDIPEAYNIKDLPTIMKDLNELVGLKEIKEQINDLVSLLRFNKKTNICINDFSLHMCFLGNPGTGKTTVARLITDILFNLGYIKQNKLTEVAAKDLVAGYIGQTALKTYDLVSSAFGGVLFIDEAYSITNGKDGNKSDFGSECIATLLKLMEDYRDKLIVIFAGYNDEMKDFLESNPGLTSRIGYKIEFPDYSIDELVQIFMDLLHKNNMTVSEKAIEKLKPIIEKSSKNKNFGNGRYIRNIFQKILIEHARNLDEKNIDENLFLTDDVFLITENDINYEKLIVENKEKKAGF